MAVEFNRFNNYNNFNLHVDKDAAKKAQNSKEETTEVENQVSAFKGLENETDLLTQNAQNLYGLRFNATDIKDRAIADETNKILADLGFKFKVTPEQVASVANEVSTVIMPALKQVEDAAVAARIEDPNGPFADLFAKDI